MAHVQRSNDTRAQGSTGTDKLATIASQYICSQLGTQEFPKGHQNKAFQTIRDFVYHVMCGAEVVEDALFSALMLFARTRNIIPESFVVRNDTDAVSIGKLNLICDLIIALNVPKGTSQPSLDCTDTCAESHAKWERTISRLWKRAQCFEKDEWFEKLDPTLQVNAVLGVLKSDIFFPQQTLARFKGNLIGKIGQDHCSD